MWLNNLTFGIDMISTWCFDNHSDDMDVETINLIWEHDLHNIKIDSNYPSDITADGHLNHPIEDRSIVPNNTNVQVCNMF